MYLTACEVICAAGRSDTLLRGLQQSPRATMISRTDLIKNGAGYFGAVDVGDYVNLPIPGRTCQILYFLADRLQPELDRLKSQYRPGRVVVIIGSTTTGIDRIEASRRIDGVNYCDHQELAAVSENLARYCGLDGPNTVVSTACTSGGKALGLARQLIEAGWVDAALVGGGESLTRLACQGFESLESYASGYCRPFQKDRDGINIGEGGALFILEKEPGSGVAVRLSGYGESSDAYHESAPDPEGKGAEKAIHDALHDAGLEPDEIGYINLHGTGTRLNDQMEAGVIQRIFGSDTPVSSTKSVIGHTLGAAGAVEAAILWSILRAPDSVSLPSHHGADLYDPNLPALNVIQPGSSPVSAPRAALSTSFAFGGHNVALVLTREENDDAD